MRWTHLLRGVTTSCLLASVIGGVRGQTGLNPAQLPKSTVFYLAWHGTPPAELRKANSLLSLWDDPDFAPLRAKLIESVASESAKRKAEQPELTSDEMADISSLLDNEFVVGYLSDPSPARAVVSTTANLPHRWQGGFLVYDRSGKEATLAKLMLRARMNAKEPPKITTITINGIPAMKMERGSSTSYWAEDGKYAFSASESAVFEQIVGWAKHNSPEATSLGKTQAYQEAAPLLRGGVVEFFLHLPSVKELRADANPGGFRLGPMLQNLRIDAIHAIAGNLVLDGARTRMQGAILGDTSTGTPFDIWGDAVAVPGSMQLVGENTVSYTSSQINLVGIYNLIARALRPAGSSSQNGPVNFIEDAAQTRLGMPLADALGAFSGEFASVQNSASFDPTRQVYFVGIRKKPEALKLLRAGLEERLSGERTEGDVTFFRVSQGGIHSEAGTAAWKYLHVAVAPDGILVSGKSDTLRAALATRKAHAQHLPQSWQTARESFPKSLDGLSFIDLGKFDWAGMQKEWTSKTNPGPGKADAKAAASPSTLDQAVSSLNPQLLQRHLHLAVSASWKDAQGLHLDGWIE